MLFSPPCLPFALRNCQDEFFTYLIVVVVYLERRHDSRPAPGMTKGVYGLMDILGSKDDFFM